MGELTPVREVGVSFIRTSIVPTLAALILQYVGTALPFLSIEQITWVLTFVLSGVWYLVFRGIEVLSQNPKVKRWAGIFLGYPRATVSV